MRTKNRNPTERLFEWSPTQACYNSHNFSPFSPLAYLTFLILIMCLWNTPVWVHLNVVCMCPIWSVWLSKAVLWCIKERPLCWAWDWHFIDIKNRLMADWFGFDPAVKRLERPEAKHNVIKIKETKTQTISHLDDAITKALNRKAEN